MSAPITLVGRLGADPDLKFGQSGKAVVRLRVVTNSRRQVDGQWKDVDATWWSVVAFGPLAEQATENLSKGSAVIVVGKAKESEWTDKDGNARKSIEIVADSIGPDLRWANSGITREKPTTFDDDPWAKPAEQVLAPF